MGAVPAPGLAWAGVAAAVPAALAAADAAGHVGAAPAVAGRAEAAARGVVAPAERPVRAVRDVVTAHRVTGHVRMGAQAVAAVATPAAAGVPAALLTAQVYAKTRAQRRAAQPVTAHARRRRLAPSYHHNQASLMP